MGTTEFMLALTMDPEGSHKLIKKITDFVCDWISWQKECFPSIDGVLILDDIVGFVGDAEFQEFVHPYLKKIFSVTGSKARFLHNDAEGLITASNLDSLGINMFNFSFNHSMGEIRELAGPKVILVGNIPARDVLGSGTPVQVEEAVKKAFGEITVHENIIWSAGGGMPPDVNDENIHAFINSVNKLSK
jgi:uroporphyrinogen decarboxylase